MIYVGFYVEIVALIWVLSMQLPQNRLRKSCRFDEDVILKSIGLPMQWIPIAVSTGVTVLYAAVLYWCRVIAAEEASAYLFVSLLLLQVMGIYRTVYRIKNVKFRMLSYIPALLLLLPAVAFVLLSFPIPTLGLANWSIITLLSLPMMPTACALLWFFLPFFQGTTK